MKNLFLFFSVCVLVSVIFGCQSHDENADVDRTVKLSVESGEHWQGSMKILFFSVKKNPQMAAWIEDEDGNYISTISVTERSAKKNWMGAPKEGRPESLPVWNHRLPDSVTDDDLDVISSASAKDSVTKSVDETSLIYGKVYHIYLEINHSFDYNDYYTEENSGVNGQPSLVYHASFSAGQPGKINLVPEGHGSLDGSSGTIDGDLESITSALHIIDSAWIDVK